MRDNSKPISMPSAGFDATLGLIRDGYLFAANRHRRLESDIFRSRLLLKKAIFIHGAEAARIFYDNAKFIRKCAVPERVQNMLFGKAGVQTLDGAAHHHRKALFLAVTGPESLARFKEKFESQWGEAIQRWRTKRSIVLFDEGRQILFRAVCDWANIPYEEAHVAENARDLSLMVDAFGAVGLRHLRGRLAHRHMETWAVRKIEQARLNRSNSSNILQQVALFKDADGNLLPASTAAVELLNIIRPTVAIAYYIAFIGHALHVNPHCRSPLTNDPDYRTFFVQKIRRFYPFTPVLGAKVRESFDWQGYHFPKGTLTILDIYGTDHDGRLWPEPERFLPERFQTRAITEFNFLPSGGGDAKTGHRGPGEGITCDALDISARMILSTLAYDVPAQDFSIDLSRMPTRPKSKCIIENLC